jgi:esterase/lipase
VFKLMVGCVFLCLCQGCTYLELLPHAYSGNATPARNFSFADGGHAIYFSLDKNLEGDRFSTDIPGNTISTYLFVVAGSDCTSMQYFLPDYFHGLEGESGPLRIFILQKRFITAHTWGRFLGCGHEFSGMDHPTRWIEDQDEFIHAQLTHAKKNNIAPKRIVVMGISEGGDIVPILAQRIEAVTHAVILANGGMNPLDAYRLQAKKQGFEAALHTLDVALSSNSETETKHSEINGRTRRYWTELKKMTHTDNLLGLSIPLLMAMGDADQAVPVESALYLRDRFLACQKSNLTLWIYPDADHGLQQHGQSRLTDFMHALDLWLQE